MTDEQIRNDTIKSYPWADSVSSFIDHGILCEAEKSIVFCSVIRNVLSHFYISEGRMVNGSLPRRDETHEKE